MPFEWRKRKQGTPNQIGQAFPIEPHGDKSKLPKGLKQVAFSEIPDYWKQRKKKHMTEEEIEEEEIIKQAVEQAEKEAIEDVYRKNLLEKLSSKIEKYNQTQELKKALDEAKQEHKLHISESGDGYGEYAEDLQKKRKEAVNDVFG